MTPPIGVPLVDPCQTGEWDLTSPAQNPRFRCAPDGSGTLIAMPCVRAGVVFPTPPLSRTRCAEDGHGALPYA